MDLSNEDLFEHVNVRGDIRFSDMHHNYFGMYDALCFVQAGRCSAAQQPCCCSGRGFGGSIGSMGGWLPSVVQWGTRLAWSFILVPYVICPKV